MGRSLRGFSGTGVIRQVQAPPTQAEGKGSVGLRPMLRACAQASGSGSSSGGACVEHTVAVHRYKAGKPLSALDGVPFAVKDLMDALPCPTASGTTFIASQCVHSRAPMSSA